MRASAALREALAAVDKHGVARLAHLFPFHALLVRRCWFKHHYYLQTPLHRAAHRGHATTVSLLLQLKADPNKTDRHGQTALHWAAYGGSTDAISALLTNKRPPKCVVRTLDASGKRAVDVAAAKRYDAVVHSLVKAGSPPPTAASKGTWVIKTFWHPDDAAKVCMHGARGVCERCMCVLLTIGSRAASLPPPLLLTRLMPF